MTGATGFIGSHLSARLVHEGAAVHAFVRPNGDRSRLSALSGAMRFWEGDITDPVSLHAAFAGAEPDVVIHLAADTQVRRLGHGWAGVDRSIRVNLQGTMMVLQATLEAGYPASTFIRAGGLEEYGDGPTPYREDQREQPISPYSASQVAATHYCEMMQRGTDTRIVTLRPALVYGPGQSNDFFIPSLITSCLRGIDFDMSAGIQRRDLLYIDDLIDAFLFALTGRTAQGIINVGHGVEHSIRDVAELIVRLTGTTARLRIGSRPERERDLQHLVTTTGRAEKLLGWRAQVELPEGIARTIRWYNGAPVMAAQ